MDIPVIFLVESNHVDSKLLRTAIESRYNCIIYSFFSLQETLNYAHLEPNLLIADFNSAALGISHADFLSSQVYDISQNALKYILLSNEVTGGHEIWGKNLLSNSMTSDVRKCHFKVIEQMRLLLAIQVGQKSEADRNLTYA